MTYQDQLSPWVIHQLLPNLNRQIVARFRRRTEAEAYLKAVKQMRSAAQFAIAFDAPVNHSTPSATSTSTTSTKTSTKASTKVTSATATPVVSR